MQTVDSILARELALVLENNGNFYKNRMQCVIRNMVNKQMKGVYDPALELKAWFNIVRDWNQYTDDMGVKKVNKATLLETAKELMESSQETIEYDLKDALLRKEWTISAIRKASLASGSPFFSRDNMQGTILKQYSVSVEGGEIIVNAPHHKPYYFNPETAALSPMPWVGRQ